MTSISSKVRTGSLWVAASRILSNGLGLISTLVLARLLLPADFGVVAIGTTILTIINSITDISLTQALIHHEQPDDRHLDCAWTLSMLRGLILALLLAVSSPWVAKFYGDPRLEMVIVVVGSTALFAGLANPRLAMLKRDLLFWQDFVLQLSQKIAMVGCSVTVAIVTHSYVALIAGMVASELVGVVTSYLFVPYRPSFRLKEAGDFLAFSGWLTLSQLVQTLNWRLDPLIIGRFVGSSDLGLFTVSQNLATLPTRETTQPLTATLFPAFRQLRNDPDRFRAAYTRAQTLVSAVALPSGTLMALMAEPFVRLVIGAKWLPAVPMIEVLSITVAIQTMGTCGYPAAMAVGRTRQLFRRSTQALVFRLPVIFAGLMLDGLRGLLLARAILCMTSLLLDTLLVREVIGLSIRQQIWSNRRTLLACGAMALAGSALARTVTFETSTIGLISNIFALAAVGAAAYLASLFALWAIGGRPRGPEREILDAAAKLAALIRRRSGPRESEA